jgi:uncharacterized protein
MSGLRIDVADLLTHPSARRPLHLEVPVDGLAGSAADVDEPVGLDLVLERVPDGIVVRGTVHARWEAQCSMCLRDLRQDLDVDVAELFETDPIEGETYPIEGHEIDLEQLVRDAVLLELPLAPACADDPDCAPEAAATGPDDAPVDPRWAVLSELEL